MVQDTNILEPIITNLRMPQLVGQLSTILKNEQRAREAFYEKIQPGDKWEFINGKIIMHSPAKDKHTNARENLGGILMFYVNLKGTGKLYSETAMVSLTRNDYLPDIVYFSNKKATTFTSETWKYPAADFVVEVLSKSTAATDKGIKKEDYAAHGTEEYWLVDPDKKMVEQFVLNKEKGEYELFAKKKKEETIECQVIAGLSFSVEAIFDDQKQLQVVRQILIAG